MHPVAQRLLDAQVAFHLEQLRGDQAASTAATFTDELLDATADQQIADLVDREVVKDVIARVLAAAPGSPVATGLLDLVVDVAMKGPAEPYPLGELVDRERLEAVLDALVGLSPLVDKVVAQLADSPVVGAAASRFMARIVAEVANANKAVADKMVPGLGALVSFGTNTAASVVGAAGKPLEGLLGDTMGKSGAFAVRRLGRIVTDTLQDPTTKEAVLQAWDLAAARDVTGLGRVVGREQVDEVVTAVQALGISTAASEHVAALIGVLVDRFFDDFGGYTPTELLEQLDLDRVDVREDVARAAPGLLTLLDEAGVLERLLRARLEPFYGSPEVDEILEG
ncbi:hypothetical protein DJ010_00610 [Nocardioides silvaticus]|uniref:Uncharacterized protein n=1 Tax=Nocardioides silvaticus TaxID=2201891 RepID=A0A316TKQ0_9ACTN|nr:hypothetical protein [Nocardioides silvaticus]PWN04191.1 hypothetical protein DJ010_00610 [Nocardioides silvaticus]